MSLAARDAALSARRSDLSSAVTTGRKHLRALAAITRCIANNDKLSCLSNFDSDKSPLDDSVDAELLKTNDITHGRYFDDTSIPFPRLTRHDDSISVSKPNRPSEHSPNPLAAPAGADRAAQATSPSASAAPASSDDSMKLRSGLNPSSERSEGDRDESQTSLSDPKASQTDEQAVIPDDVAPPEPVEESHLSGATQQLLDDEHPARPPRVVQLPESPQRQAEPVEATKRAPARSSTAQLQTQAEPASSPSSTVGPYSAATPLPPQDSPDTSPDSESADQPEEAVTPVDLQPSLEAQQEKNEHDKRLEAQKEIARKQALGDVSDPNDQLLWEEREAAARAAEEQKARLSVGGPEADAPNATEETSAEQAVDEMDAEKEVEKIESEPVADEKTADVPTASVEGEDDEDNITVKPRARAPAPLVIDTSKLQTVSPDRSSETPAKEVQSVTPAASSTSTKRTASEAFVPSRIPRDGPPPSAVSPLAARHPQDTAPPAISVSTPKKDVGATATRPPHTPDRAQMAVDDLLALKGAATDPDRDYLESLFRIQAYDSPNIRSTGLTDLVRSASKALSTQDHFTSSHERLDYRELRKVYQLQNANKWSLRQMERAKEPPQPVTHHDHMMAEMKWMRKDFKAERKMKRSVCAWLAARCADWVNADAEDKKIMQVKVRQPLKKLDADSEDQPPELEHSGESAAEDDASPPTPRQAPSLPPTVVVPPELSETVADLRKTGKLEVALRSLPIAGWRSEQLPHRAGPEPVSKFVKGTVFPPTRKPKRKRSKFDYDDDDELLNSEGPSKRLREDRELPPEDEDIALFHPDNKPIRDRLHANNTFRPPSEFAMPSTSFYEYRNGSQWVWEDDQKLRKLAKEYSFNWSLISDELTLPASFKSSAERRTPWECFERWVELEQLPSEMRKTMYFKTWYQRLESSQQAAERRYQAQVAALQAANGQQAQVPSRRRITPTRVEKRKNTRYLWLVDAMRKLARKKEAQAYKQAEAQRAAAQRKTQSTDPNHQRAPIKTPKEFSKMRQELDAQQAERLRQHRQKLLEAQQQRNMMAQRQQQGQQGQQQRPGSSSTAPAQQAQMQGNAQQQPNGNGQQGRSQVPLATRNGHLAVPQVNGQGMPQAQMRPNGHMQNPQDMQRIAQANAQARHAQYGGQQQQQQQQYAQMQASPGSGGMSNQQQIQSNQAMLAAMQHQGGQQGYQQNGHQMNGSPSMPPPPTPQNGQKQLSSGHVPAILGIQTQLRQKYPQASDEQINTMATEMLRNQSQQSTNSARQSAMNAAAGINNNAGGQQHGNMQQAYAQNQAAFQHNQHMRNGNVPYPNGDGNQQGSPQQQQQYAAAMRARQMQQMGMQQQSPGMNHATANGSPSMASASPAPVSPSMQFSNPNVNGTPQMAAAQLNMGQRPPSRSATPQMQRLGSSGSVPGMQQGMPSPGQVNGLQGSPRNMQASMAR